MKTFILNGKEYHTSSNFTLYQCINYFNYNSSLLVLEYNNCICPKDKWDQINIEDNDKIELVTIVGGG